MKLTKQYLVHLCANTHTADCKDIWVTCDDSQDPELEALLLYPNHEAIRLVFGSDEMPVTKAKGESK